MKISLNNVIRAGAAVVFVAAAMTGSLAGVAAVALAAGTLSNGGLGQSAADQTHFGVAVCNHGASALEQSVPVAVAANGQSKQVASAAPIAPGACEYSYLAYSDLGLQGGQSYSVSVTIDNADHATYDVAVPAGASGANGSQGSGNNPGTANASQQSGNIFVAIGRWFISLFGLFGIK